MFLKKFFTISQMKRLLNTPIHLRLLRTVEHEYADSGFKFLGSIIAWLPFLFWILILPSQLYLTNALNFEFRSDILYPYLGISFVTLIVLILVGISSAPWVQKLLDGFFFLGLFAVLSFNVTPLDWGKLDGQEVLRESWQWSVVQALIFLILLVCWLHLPSASFRKAGAIFVFILFSTQLFNLQHIFRQAPKLIPADEPEVVVNDTETIRPNIYHIVFDAYSGRTFRNMSKMVGLDEDLSDFTFFPNAMAQYPVTDLSVPSYLTGKTYRTGSVKQFQLEAKTGGLSEILRQAGYITSSYSPTRAGYWSHNNASRIFATSDAFKHDVEKTFALVSAVRAAPELFRMNTHRLASKMLWGGQNYYSHYRTMSVPLMEQFLDDEEGRSGQSHYNYVHLLLPHAPFVWSGDCVIEGQTNYMVQAECASRLMKRFIAKLKDLGRYENSIILLHSDHGFELETNSANLVTPFTQQVKTIYENSDRQYSAREVVNKLNALLLIKPTGEGKRSLVVSDQIVQLVDIPATVLGLLSMEPPAGEGRQIFSNYQERDVSIFVPIHSTSTIRKQTNLGGEQKKIGVLSHFSFSRRKGWEVHPDIDIFHEGW